MGARRRTKQQNRVKHPEIYCGLVIFGFVMYTVLVYKLYSERHLSVPKESSKTLHGVFDAAKLVNQSYLQLLIPEEKNAILARPNVSHVTNRTMVIFVQSDYSNTERRQLIRQTWGNHRHYSSNTERRPICVIFAVGLKGDRKEDTENSLDLEMLDNNDILLLNIADVYDSLTIKGLLTMKWIYKMLPQMNYVIKTDDDMFLNTFGWMSAMQALETNNMTCVIAGFVWTNPEVMRSGKYAVTKDAYPPDQFPSFCSGAGYLLSRDSMAAIFEASDHIPLLVRDDPYYTGILARSMGITLLTFPKATVRFERSFLVNNLANIPVMAIHGLETRHWYRLWNGLRLRHVKNQRHRVKMRTLHAVERGIQVTRLSASLGEPLDSECPSSIVRFSAAIWS